MKRLSQILIFIGAYLLLGVLGIKILEQALPWFGPFPTFEVILGLIAFPAIFGLIFPDFALGLLADWHSTRRSNLTLEAGADEDSPILSFFWKKLLGLALLIASVPLALYVLPAINPYVTPGFVTAIMWIWPVVMAFLCAALVARSVPVRLSLAVLFFLGQGLIFFLYVMSQPWK